MFMVDKMRILVLVSGEKNKGNTKRIVDAFLCGLKKGNHDIKCINLCEVQINPCKDCNACVYLKDKFCVQEDGLNEILDEIMQSDCIVFASPIYFSFFSGTMKLLIDRFHAIGKKYNYDYPKKKFIVLATAAGDGSSFNLLKAFINEIFIEHMKWEELAFYGVSNCKFNDDFISKENDLMAIEEIGEKLRRKDE